MSLREIIKLTLFQQHDKQSAEVWMPHPLTGHWVKPGLPGVKEQNEQGLSSRDAPLPDITCHRSTKAPAAALQLASSSDNTLKYHRVRRRRLLPQQHLPAPVTDAAPAGGPTTALLQYPERPRVLARRLRTPYTAGWVVLLCPALCVAEWRVRHLRRTVAEGGATGA